ncbi:MAG: histidine kinase [Bacteroidia bacterium]|nr:histidine kinase [Bacteroidia bacterium]MDW8345391.1 histidine kinase [Bacteroidia bacterium]
MDKNWIEQLNKYKLLYHSIFWIALWYISFDALKDNINTRRLLLSRINDQDTFAAVLCTTLLVPIIIYTYLNIYLFDVLFSRRKYISYFLSLAVTGLIIAISMHTILVNVLASEVSFLQAFSNLMFSTLMIVGIRFMKNGLSKQYQLQEAKAKQIESELNLLKSQINPHFLFNTLNNIYAVNMSNPQNANEMILQLADLMRYQLESSKKEQVPLSDEVEMIKNYIALEKMRLPNNAFVSFQTQGDFSLYSIAPMLLIPFVENCFKHGVGVEQTHIEIYAFIKNGEFFFITKNLIPMTKLTNTVSTKTGIQNLERRLEILYPKKHGLLIDVEEGMYIVRLRIQL